MQRSQTHIEAEGGTTEDAIADGLRRLGTNRGEVDIKIIDEGKKGFLGMGSRPARVFLSLKKKGHSRPEREPEPADRREEADPHKSAEYAKEVLSKLLGMMGFEASLTSSVRDGQISISVDAADREGLLIGRRGETLQSLEHVVTRMTSRHMRERANVVVDVSGYRERRADSLQATAREMGEEVLRSGREVQTDFLVAADRRVVHRTLSEMNGVETEAIGDGVQKRITIRRAGTGTDGGGRDGDEARGRGGRGGPRRGGRDRGDRGDRGGRRRRGGPREGERPERREESTSDRRPGEDVRAGRNGHDHGASERPRREERPRHEERPREERPRREEGPRHEERPRREEPPRREERPQHEERPARGAEPLDLLGSLGGKAPEKRESADEGSGQKKTGLRSRRRRPARKRL